MAPLRKAPHEHTVEFLRALDPQTKHFTFQTFREKGSEADVAAKVLHSWKELLREHEQGAGVYVCVNETNLAGRKAENIKRIRSIWQEDDEGYSGAFPLEPSMIVESSPGHFHRYWLVADDWPADEQGRRDFDAIMQRMVESYGSDKNAKDLCRVMRVPGFLHRKNGGSRLVRLVKSGGQRYTRAEILKAFPPVERETKKETPRTEYKPQGDEDERIREALTYIDPAPRDIWRDIGMALKEHMGESGRPLWDDWSRRCVDKFDEKDQDKTWKSFHRHDIKIGTLFHHAKLGGWEAKPQTHDRAGNAGSGEGRKSGAEKSAPEKRTAILVRADQIKPKSIDWGWKNRFAFGKMNMFAGDPGLGQIYNHCRYYCASQCGRRLSHGRRHSRHLRYCLPHSRGRLGRYLGPSIDCGGGRSKANSLSYRNKDRRGV
jgi:Primase C terminal 2 (PriCT-2)/RepB DNA-primase from phage plasmid